MEEKMNKSLKEESKKKFHQEESEVNLVRILGKDIRGDKKLLLGLTKINGISWTFASAVCRILNLDKNKKIQDVTPEEIKVLENFIRNPDVPAFIKNRQRDFDDGEDKHISGADLKLKKEFDIKRLKKIKSYKGVRHTAGLPVRGQRTRSNFRKNRKKSGAVGLKKK